MCIYIIFIYFMYKPFARYDLKLFSPSQQEKVVYVCESEIDETFCTFVHLCFGSKLL